MAGILEKALAVGIGMMLLFILASTLIMPQFSKAWRYCQAKEWVGTQGGVLTNCTTPYQTANTTFVDNTTATHTEDGETNPRDTDTDGGTNRFCLNCKTLGGYRTTVQGLVVLVLMLALITFGLHFFPRRRF